MPRVTRPYSKYHTVLKSYSYWDMPITSEIRRRDTVESVSVDSHTMTATADDHLDPTIQPETILYRDDEQRLLHATISDAGTQHLYLHGPRGAGKTLLARNALTTATVTNAYYLSCIAHDTQYKVLERLYTRITDDDINAGYHTAQLQDRLVHHLCDANTVIVLDDLAFLLANDGNDLLYFLSRLDRRAGLCLIGISATQPSLAPVLDERTYSSLRPHHLAIAPYTSDQVIDILTHRIEAALPPDTVNPAALEYIGATTSNITLGLHWLRCATAQATTITVDILQAVQATAIERYRETLLAGFTWHHTVLLKAIVQATTDTASITTGTAYKQYTERCKDAGIDPLTARRVSDYLTHLELLNLIDVRHYYGGKRGKTREIRLTPLQQL